MGHHYYKDGFDVYRGEYPPALKELKNESISNRGRTMSGFDAHKEEVATQKESRAPAWKQGIPTVAGRYFYADDIRNLDIPRYCTVLKGESWGGPDVHYTYIEISFKEENMYEDYKHLSVIEHLCYQKIKFIDSDKLGLYIDLDFQENNTRTTRSIKFNSVLNKYWFYGPLDIPKEV